MKISEENWFEVLWSAKTRSAESVKNALAYYFVLTRTWTWTVFCVRFFYFFFLLSNFCYDKQVKHKQRRGGRQQRVATASWNFMKLNYDTQWKVRRFSKETVTKWGITKQVCSWYKDSQENKEDISIYQRSYLRLLPPLLTDVQTKRFQVAHSVYLSRCD